MKRRTFLKAGMAGSMLGVAASVGLLTPRAILAAWPESAFKANKLDDAIKALFGTSDVTESGDVIFEKAPEIAENGAVVPFDIATTLKADAMALFVKENPSPLACSYELGPSAKGYVSTRIKMGKTSDVVAVVRANGKLYSATKVVKVTIGGCGG